MLKSLILILISITLSLCTNSIINATIYNHVPRVDTDGNIVNAHDGGIYLFNDTYFMYGTVYQNCSQGQPRCKPPCGYYPNTFALYTSKDLMQWKLETTNILPEMSEDNHKISYWMPNVGFNQKTQKYVMQYWDEHCGFHKACLPFAVSDSPYGPFKKVAPAKAHGGVPSDQMGMFIDDNGKAYVRYNTKNPQHHVIEELTDDWLETKGNWSIIFWKTTFPWMDGGGLFKHGDLYYYMIGSDCCFCQWGGDTRVFTSYDPLGPWAPGIAPPLPTKTCNLTGQWLSAGDLGNDTFELFQTENSQDFHFKNEAGQADGTIDQKTGYVTFPPSAGDARGVITSADGLSEGCDRIRWYGYDSFIWYRSGQECTLPSFNDPTEINFCADGSIPAQGVRFNPCDPGNATGINFTVPAQQFNVLNFPVSGEEGNKIIYYGERSQSAPDNLKSHNFQIWLPLEFGQNGEILPLTMLDSFNLDLVV